MLKTPNNYHKVYPRISKNLISPNMPRVIHIGYKMIFNILKFILYAIMIPPMHKPIQHE